MTEPPKPRYLVELTAELVAAYAANNQTDGVQLAQLIGSIHDTLASLATGAVEPPAEPKAPPIPIKKSVTPDYIVCLEDGKKFKALKRHLRTAYNMTPQQYRTKWNLPSDYPMVAPNYTAARSVLAKSMGLGQRSRTRAASDDGGRRARAAKTASTSPRTRSRPSA